MIEAERVGRRRLAVGLGLVTVILLAAGLAAGSDGWSPTELVSTLESPDAWLIVGQIRTPRTLGAWLVGALLGLAGAVAQGLFRNPLADPYLLGSASGASLGVVLVLTSGAVASADASLGGPLGFARLGLVGAAFAGALLGVMSTLALARGAQPSTRLLLAGVLVGIVLGAVGDLLTSAAPEALRGRQAFMLGSTGFLGWAGCGLMAAGLVIAAVPARLCARGLDALTLGADSARSLGIDLARTRLALISSIALATALAVSQSGLIAFVGLVAPHLVRRLCPTLHAFTIVASAAAGGALLLFADVLSRSLIAPREIPVGVLTALLGGGYLLGLLRRGGHA